MWRQWFKKNAATLVIADDGIVLRENNNRDQILLAQQPTMQTIESSLRQHQAKVTGKRLSLILAGTWSRMMVLPWQEKVNRREDWEALGQQALQKNSNDSAKWFCRAILAGYGEPVYIIGIQETLHDLLTAIASEIGFVWQAIKPLNALLIQQYSGTDQLVIVEPGFISVMQLAGGSLSGVQLLKPPLDQEIDGLQQYFAREQILNSRAKQVQKTKVLVSSAVKQDWVALEKEHSNIAVMKTRGESISHAHWIAQQGV